MDVHTPDEHLATPPLGSLDQLGVSVPGRELLGGPLSERMGARPEEIDADVVGDPAHHTERLGQVCNRLAGVAADTRDEFNGVAEQLFVDAIARTGVVEFTDPLEEPRCRVRQVASLLVDERELPLDADGRRR